MNYLSILKRPVVSEKSFQSSTQGKFTFVVSKEATKTLVRKAFEELYGYSVKGVSTHIVPRKERMVGRGVTLTRRPTEKRAIVQVKGDASGLDVTKVKK